MGLAPGTQVTPNVRLLELLGEGGMGSVWIAEHAGLRTRVAVKFVSTDLVERDPSLMERFNREAALTAQIKSPHVIQTFDHGVMPDGQPYIVMELLEGEPLSERLDREGRLSPEETCLIVQQTAKGLSRAHRVGVVHRDIKPENLFLVDDEDGLFVKILDFGIAKQTSLPKTENVTGTNMMVGTPEYMSPEQVLSAKTVSARADLWSLAVVAYRCLTGGVPFSGETVGALAVAIANGTFNPPSTYRRELRPGVDDWFRKALATEASERFDDAKELARTFAAAILGAEALLSMPDASLASLPPPPMPAGDDPSSAEIALPRAPNTPTFSGATLVSERTKALADEATSRSPRWRVLALSLGGLLLVSLGGAVAVVAASGWDPRPDGAPPRWSPPDQPATAASAALDEGEPEHPSDGPRDRGAEPEGPGRDDAGAAGRPAGDGEGGALPTASPDGSAPNPPTATVAAPPPTQAVPPSTQAGPPTAGPPGTAAPVAPKPHHEPPPEPVTKDRGF